MICTKLVRKIQHLRQIYDWIYDFGFRKLLKYLGLYLRMNLVALCKWSWNCIQSITLRLFELLAVFWRYRFEWLEISSLNFIRTQCFVCSHVEKTALVQNQGGPCAILAPLQAQLLLELINRNELFNNVISSSDGFMQAVSSVGATKPPYDTLLRVLADTLIRCSTGK